MELAESVQGRWRAGVRTSLLGFVLGSWCKVKPSLEPRPTVRWLWGVASEGDVSSPGMTNELPRGFASRGDQEARGYRLVFLALPHATDL